MKDRRRKPTLAVIRWAVPVAAVLLAAHGRTFHVGASASAASHRSRTGRTALDDLAYMEFPRRTEEEAAVLEWGNSAVISALDASVARFGPRTDQAALLEVECTPVLASPLNGVLPASHDVDPDAEGGDGAQKVDRLLNAEETDGNMVVMTNNGGLTYVEMATLAKDSGAAALLVVNVDEKRPDDIFRMEANRGESADHIDIPVVMISLNSANVLTTATVEAGMGQEDIVNHGMPDRVRLYAAGDRPFFEDVEPIQPTLYLIHNLLTDVESDGLVARSKHLVKPVSNDHSARDILQLSDQHGKFVKVSRAMLWQGTLQGQSGKACEERIEQVTGFPSAHFSDFVVDRIDPGGYWQPHFDTFGGTDDSGGGGEDSIVPVATITVFLTDAGGPIVYPSGKEPIKVNPQKGMAVVHHNTNNQDDRYADLSTLHAMLPNKMDVPVYVARKYVFATPVSNARRVVLPLIATISGGRMPSFISAVHEWFCAKFGPQDGPAYFDKACVFLPVLIVLAIAQYVVEYVQKQMSAEKRSEDKKPRTPSKPTKSKKS